MDEQSNLSRRNIIKWGLLAAGTPAISKVAPQNLGPGNQYLGDVGGRDHHKLFTGDHAVGGGQMEIRLNQSSLDSRTAIFKNRLILESPSCIIAILLRRI